MDYSDRQVIVTGGTGALGSAVVGALVEAGATCYVPWRHESEAHRFPFREHNQVKLFGSIDLTDESALSGSLAKSRAYGPQFILLADSPCHPWPKPARAI
jgi:NAD(P)-dependent dehydrogenase (short-subunit alcohol dehydrogenase family)